jgi:type IV pilus assembly protein PilX
MNPKIPLHRLRPARRQRGVVMLFGLLALAIMLIGTVAMVRSMNTTLTSAGNLGFKRDLTNQGERAVALVLTALQTGALASATTRNSNLVSANYSASILATNAQGLPTALVQDSAFSAVGSSSNDIAIAEQGVTVRYLVDRLCTTSGTAEVDRCTMADPLLPTGASASELGGAEFGSIGGSGAIGAQVIYRVSIRVTGPRQTQAYFQTTMTL